MCSAVVTINDFIPFKDLCGRSWFTVCPFQYRMTISFDVTSVLPSSHAQCATIGYTHAMNVELLKINCHKIPRSNKTYSE